MNNNERTPNVPTGCFAALYYFEFQYDKWKKIKTVPATKEKILEAINNPVQTKPFYKFECYDENDNPLGTVFTINPELF